jgi:DNA-binding XRE family transcriptional regulator
VPTCAAGSRRVGDQGRQGGPWTGVKSSARISDIGSHAAGLSQEALADRAGLHWTYVGSVERGERNVSVDNICRLAWALGVDVPDLFRLVPPD